MFKIFFYFVFIIVIAICNGCSDNSEMLSPSPIPEYTQIDFEPSWSPAANKITYVHSNVDPELTGIYIINYDGTNNRQLINSFANSPDWSPDESTIVFSQSNQIYKIKTNGDSLTSLTNNSTGSNPKWSNDGSWIAYMDCGGVFCNVWIMKPDGHQKTMVDENAIYPNWVNGSSSLIYFKPVKNNDGSQSGDTLYQYFLGTGLKQVITVLDGDDHKINLYPVYAEDAIIFCSMNKDVYFYIYKMNLNGSNITKLTTTQSYSPDYSSSNQKIIYTNRNKGNGRLWFMDKSGNNKVQFTF